MYVSSKNEEARAKQKKKDAKNNQKKHDKASKLKGRRKIVKETLKLEEEESVQSSKKVEVIG